MGLFKKRFKKLTFAGSEIFVYVPDVLERCQRVIIEAETQLDQNLRRGDIGNINNMCISEIAKALEELSHSLSDASKSAKDEAQRIKQGNHPLLIDPHKPKSKM